MDNELSTSARKVQAALDAIGLPLQVVELPASTRTAVEAAQAIGCQVGQIVKSLIFRRRNTGLPLLVMVSGANWVNEEKVSEKIGEPIGKADPDFVRQQTGFAIGGVPPLGHTQPIQTLIDADLLTFQEIWAAAGTPSAVFRLTPTELVKITQGQVMEIK